MAVTLCPTCSGKVAPQDASCPSCGRDLPASGPAVTRPDSELPPRLLDFTPGQTFAGRYTVIESIGAGGMGVVYKAIDTELGEPVVLKLIHPALAERSSFVERFKREARVTRKITHPNICRLHDIGKSGEVLYLSMEWIEGESLQQLLRQSGILRESRALEIASKVARALGAAHEKGIIHRDLKPANVMIDKRGKVRVLDFGLALEEGQHELTAAGMAVGTPWYMSPEQRGGATVDGRTDLYALGLILLEMLTGRQAVVDPSLPENLPPEINPLIGPLLRRLLAWNEDERYSSAAELGSDLDELRANPAISTVLSTPEHPSEGRRLKRRKNVQKRFYWFAAAIIAVAGVIAWIYWPRPDGEVLNRQARDFYERGLHYLREDLETIEGVEQAIQFFHRALEHQADSPLVMARLADAYWRQFAKGRRAASREEAERWLDKAARLDPTLAEVHYARATGYIFEGKYTAAKPELETALEAKPDLAVAWAALGDVHMELDEYQAGVEALDKAMELEPGSFHMQINRGIFHLHFQEHAEAAKYFAKAAELKPDSFMAWDNVGNCSFFSGQFDKAIPAYLRSLEIKENPNARSNLGTIFFFEGDYEKAAESYRRATELKPDEAANWGNLGDALMALEENEDAIEAYARAADVARERVVREPLNPDALMQLGEFCAQAGDRECALENAGSAFDLQPTNALFMLKYGKIHCLLGQSETALDWLERAVKLGATQAQIDLYPELACVREDPRYDTIISPGR